MSWKVDGLGMLGEDVSELREESILQGVGLQMLSVDDLNESMNTTIGLTTIYTIWSHLVKSQGSCKCM